MLILLPVLIIVLVIFAIDTIYFDDVKSINPSQKKTIEKYDNRKEYINKYLKQ